jgi:ribonuclease P protein component
MPSATVPGRIHRTADYRRVLRGGKRVAGGLVIAYVQVTGHPSRVGFVCGRGVGGAVARNRARRLLKEAWRLLLPRVQDGFDLVVVARPEIRGADMGRVGEDMAAAMAAAGVVDR